jgi:proprotein convertase subtilisin/kexin type 5
MNYYKSNNTCVKCGGTCMACNPYGCLRCNGYDNSFGVGISCGTCVSGCTSCQMNSTGCMSCLNGYFSAGICKSCAAVSCQNCQNNTCLSCKQGYILQGGACPVCSSFIPNCYTCLSTAICTQCTYGYFVSNTSNSCVACSPTLYGCADCSSSTVCTVCYSNLYILQGGACVVCADVLTGTATASLTAAGYVSLTCITGFIFVASGSYCSHCSNYFIGCGACTASTCTGCLNTYYNKSGACTPCAGITPHR